MVSKNWPSSNPSLAKILKARASLSNWGQNDVRHLAKNMKIDIYLVLSLFGGVSELGWLREFFKFISNWILLGFERRLISVCWKWSHFVW
jgi:hypothetical protein